MPRYRLLLHDGPDTAPEYFLVDANDDDDAKDLAWVTLLVNQAFTHVQVWKEDRLLGVYQRDSYAD